MHKNVKMLIIFCILSLSAMGEDRMYFPKYQLTELSEKSISTFLKEYFPVLQNEDIQLQLHLTKNTTASRHFSFHVLYQNLPILNASIKLNTDLKGNIISVKKEYQDLNSLKGFDVYEAIQAWNKINPSIFAAPYWGKQRIINAQQLKLFQGLYNNEVVLEMNAWDMKQDNTIILDTKGNKLFEYDNARHFNIDTIVSVSIFSPDPLTSANQVYGGSYIDHGDTNDSWMNAQYQHPNINALYDSSNHIFYLENQFVMMDDFNLPTNPVATSLNPSFNFNRSESGFEDVNAFYHITHFHDYISSLGYDTLMNMQLVVDAHGFIGDNSVFNRNGGNPNLALGVGGVDDAEDADVIIHEYSHGISWSANNNGNFSSERAALDEGLADYFATSYSRSLSSFHWENVFSWDGHNEFWAGRTATTVSNYPSLPNIWSGGEIWNAAMSKIWTDLGNIVTDKLMLESLHFFTDNTTFPEAAMYILQSDTLLFGGMHTNIICNHFQSKNILDVNCKPVYINEIPQMQSVQLINSMGFAQNTSNAQIHFPTNNSGSLFIYNITGQLIKMEKFNQTDHVDISPFELESDIYILKIKTGNEENVFKLARW